MYTKIYWIEKFPNGGAIGIMPRPRGNDWLADEIKRLKENGIQTVVSLLERDEIQELGLQEEEKSCQANQLDYINLPIKDRGIPKSNTEVSNLVKKLIKRIDEGEKIIIHCRMGIGRASIIAGAVLIQKGLRTQEVIEKISKARERKVPDTDEQIGWLKSMEK